MDQQLLDLIDELRRLVPVLNSLSQTAGTSKNNSGGDRSTDRIINALARLTATVDTNNKTKAAEKRSIEEFTKEVDKATDAQEDFRKAQEEAAKSSQEAAKVQMDAAKRAAMSSEDLAADDKRSRQTAMRDSNLAALEGLKAENAKRTASGLYVDEMLRGLTVSNMYNKKIESMAGESIALNVAFRGMGAAVAGAVNTLGEFGKGVGKFMGELAEGNTKFTALNPIIDGVAGALGKMAEAIPFAGSAIAGGMKMVAEGSKFILSQLQKTTETFQDLGQVGALTADGMTGVQRGFLESGMTLDGYKKSIVENSQALARFGGTVGEGRDQFTRFVGSIVDSEAGNELRRIGMTADQIGESGAAFMTQQTRLGLAQNKSQAQLKQGTVEYAKELDLLGKVTGMSRKAIQSQQDAALSEGRFRAQTDEMIANGNEKGAKALIDFQTQVASISPELGAAVRDTATGFTNSEAAIKGFNASGGKIQEIVEAVKNREISQGEGMRRLQEATKENEEAQRGLAKAAGDGQDTFIKYAELSDFNRATIEGNTIKAQKAQDAQVAGQDDLTNQTVDAQKSMEQMSRQIQNFGFAVMPKAAEAVAGFTNALNEFIKGVAKATGIELKTLTGEIANSAEDITKVKTAADNVATSIDIALNPDKVLADQSSRAEKIKKQDDENWEKATITEKASVATAKAIENVGDAMGDLLSWSGLESVGNRVKGVAGAAKEERVASDTQYLKDTGRIPDQPAAGPSAGGAPAVSGGAPAVSGSQPASKPTSKPTTEPAKPGGGSSSGGSSQPSAKGVPVAPKPASSVADAGPGFTTVYTTDNDKQRREGVRNWRNNNPGNIEFGKFSKGQGAIGTDGRFAVFPTLEQGLKAKEELLFGKNSNYSRLSITDAINRYAPPNENNTAAYINSVTKAVGVPDSTILGALDSGQRSTFLNAINKVEGFKEGKVLQAAKGGVASSKTPNQFVQIAEAGLNEAFVPLPDGRSIPVNLENVKGQFSDIFKNLIPDDKSPSVDFENFKGQFSDIVNKSMVPAGFKNQDITAFGDTFVSQFEDLAKTMNTGMTETFQSMLDNITKSISKMADNNANNVTLTDPELKQLLSELVDLQRSNNSTASRILQVSTA